MRHLALTALILPLLLIPSAGFAFEVLAPAPESVVKDGRLIVIGSGAKGEKGKAEYGGKSTSFRIKDGSFSFPLSLAEGSHEVSIQIGDDKKTINWKVDSKAAKGIYKYHPELTNDKCRSCHDEGVKLTRDDQLAELCSRCHPKQDRASFVHGPVAMGLCAACHDPHGGKYARNVRLEIRELCADCHNQPVSKKHRDEAGDESCTECHHPHASSKQYMLR